MLSTGRTAVDDIIRTTKNHLVEFKILDLLNLKSVRVFAEQIKNEEKKIDILVNNAGVSKGSKAKVQIKFNVYKYKVLLLPRNCPGMTTSLEMVWRW